MLHSIFGGEGINAHLFPTQEKLVGVFNKQRKLSQVNKEHDAWNLLLLIPEVSVLNLLWNRRHSSFRL